MKSETENKIKEIILSSLIPGMGDKRFVFTQGKNVDINPIKEIA